MIGSAGYRVLKKKVAERTENGITYVPLVHRCAQNRKAGETARLPRLSS